jgi:hypothetical protein
MRSRLQSFRAAVATVVSLWMAVLACVMGCTLPSLGNSGANNPSSGNAAAVRANSGEQSQTDVMAGMKNCPHHSGGNAPAKRNERKPVRGGGMSCCPVEVTVASKPERATLQISSARSFVLESHFSLLTVRFYHAAELVPSVWQSGRDTLLETHLLRV